MMVYVDNSQITPLYENTSPGLVADASKVDPAIAALIVAINTNADLFTNFIGALFPNPGELSIPDQSIVTRHLRNLAVTNPKLAALAVTADKIADGSITLTKLADLVVTAAKIANGAVTNQKLADQSADSRVIANGSVRSQHIDPSLFLPYSDIGITAGFEQRGYDLTKFGALCNGINDDTSAFQTAVDFVSANGGRLIFSGTPLIKNQITINNAVWIEGYQESGHNHYRSASKIIFDNGDVDGSGNATKSLFKLTNTVAYKLQNIKFSNFTVVHTNQTAKNQHTFVLDRATVSYFTIENVTVYDATGSILRLVEGTIYQPEIHMINLQRINGYNVGGFLSQTGTNQSFIVGGTVSHINLEQKINTVSPQPILCDFSGFRNVNFGSFVLEGNGAVGVNYCFKFTSPNNHVDGVWMEYVTNTPPYAFDIRDSIQLSNISGLGSNHRVHAQGRFTVITIDQFPTLDTISQVFDLENGSQVFIKSAYSAITTGSFVDGKRLLVPENLTGRIKVVETSNFDGGVYSHDGELELFRLTKGMPFRVPQMLNEYISLSAFGPTPLIETSLDSDEGRVIRLLPNVGQTISQVRFDITLPSQYIGSALVLGIRYRILAANQDGDIYIPFSYSDGASYDVSNGISANSSANLTHVNALNKRSAWNNGYVSIGQTTTEPIRIFLTRARNLTTNHTILISDIVLSLGNKLPALRTNCTTPVEYWDNQLPTAGYFVRGDLIHNTEPTISGSAGSKYTISSWKRITTGTSNTLNTDWVECRSLTGS